MEEKILIRGKRLKILKWLILMFLIALLAIVAFDYLPSYSKFLDFLENNYLGLGTDERLAPGTKFKFFFTLYPEIYFNVYSIHGNLRIGALLMEIGAVLLVVLLIIQLWIGRSSIIVSNKRISGRGTFGHRVDLAMADVTGATTAAFHSVRVSVNSVNNKTNHIKFWLMKNNKDICGEISKLLTEDGTKNTALPNAELTKFDELKKYSELFDMGVITQEEFEEKKKQLMEI